MPGIRARRVPRQLSGFPGRRMAGGLAFRVMTDDHTRCRAGPAELRVMGQRHRAALRWRLRPRILSSRGESVEAHPWARRDRRNLAACCCTVDGAGRVRCVAARGVLVGMPAVRGVLPEHRPACGAGSAGADGAVRAAAGRQRYRGAAANRMGPRGPDPGGGPRRGGRGGDGPPVSPARLPRAVHRRGHAPGAGRPDQGAGRGGLRRARRRVRAGRRLPAEGHGAVQRDKVEG